ncbi:hypothetical protein REMIM1_CH01121 [Rhizobium etli bv. mimosae str. Mim1]|nr:hypothetical protein REMIM1_CH01121 [Rhizobium etli bv. mimosae str. Mim1]
MSWDLASNSGWRQFLLGHAQSSRAAAWRMEEFALADSYDRAGPIYKLNIDHVCIADL